MILFGGINPTLSKGNMSLHRGCSGASSGEHVQLQADSCLWRTLQQIPCTFESFNKSFIHRGYEYEVSNTRTMQFWICMQAKRIA